MSRLQLVVGPNGSGKSTFVECAQARLGVPYVDADLIAAERSPHEPAAHGLDAAQIDGNG